QRGKRLRCSYRPIAGRAVVVLAASRPAVVAAPYRSALTEYSSPLLNGCARESVPSGLLRLWYRSPASPALHLANRAVSVARVVAVPALSGCTRCADHGAERPAAGHANARPAPSRASQDQECRCGAGAGSSEGAYRVQNKKNGPVEQTIGPSGSGFRVAVSRCRLPAA